MSCRPVNVICASQNNVEGSPKNNGILEDNKIQKLDIYLRNLSTVAVPDYEMVSCKLD